MGCPEVTAVLTQGTPRIPPSALALSAPGTGFSHTPVSNLHKPNPRLTQPKLANTARYIGRCASGPFLVALGQTWFLAWSQQPTTGYEGNADRFPCL